MAPKKKHIKHLYGPLILIILAAAAILLTGDGTNAFQEGLSQLMGLWEGILVYLPKLLLIALIYIFAKVLFFVVFELLIKKFHELRHEEQEMETINRMMHFLFWPVFILLSLSILFENFGALITSLGLIGFGVTFALQKPILNFVGWTNILLKDVYNVGDRIKVGNVRGDVREIQVMSTVLDGLLETSDLPSKKIISIPNEFVLTHEVENYNKESNYIVEELSITVTYESDSQRAKQLLYDIASQVTHENRERLREHVDRKHASIQDELFNLGQLLKTSSKKKDIEREMDKLEAEKEDLHEEASSLDEGFQPRIRIEMEASAVVLVCQFITPYDAIKANRTKINERFLDAISHEDHIEVAYPHMQLVTEGKTKKDPLGHA